MEDKKSKSDKVNKSSDKEEESIFTKNLLDLSIYKKYIRIENDFFEEEAFALMLFSRENPEEFEKIVSKVEKDYKEKNTK